MLDSVSVTVYNWVGCGLLVDSCVLSPSRGSYPLSFLTLPLSVFGALAEFERDLIRERTNAGLAAARARGRVGGRPQKLDEKKLKMLHALYADKSNSIPDILSTLNISKSTLYRYINADKRRSTGR